VVAVHSVAFGELLRRYRKAAGLTQEELAERAGLSARGISDLERGIKAVPRKDTVQMLADALRLTPEDRAPFEAARKRGAPPDPLTMRRPAITAARSGAEAPPFVGRSRELALLERHLAGDGPPVLLLAGEPGIGKSRLLGEAAQRATSGGWQVLAGGCQRRGGQEPYAPILGALKGCMRRRSPADLRADLRGCAWLVRLLPELAAGPIEPLPAWTLAAEQERRLLFEAVARYLANMAGPAGTLLVLDDLQWAGPDALDLIAALVRSEEAPLRVIGAYRNSGVQPHDLLAVLLADLAPARLALQRTLTPLTPREVSQLLDSLLDGVESDRTVLAQRVVQRAGGVPFFVVSYADGLRLNAVADDAAGAVPSDVAQSIRQRVAALTAAAQEVMGAAAVAGRIVQPSVLTAAVTQPEAAALAGIDAACQARLLVQEEQNYQFAHDLIREVVEADLGPARRLVLHRRVAEALERLPGDRPVERLAYHYARSSEQAKAAQYLEQAGDSAAAQAAHTAAEAYFQEAVERLDGLGRVEQAGRVRAKLGTVLVHVGHYDAALSVLERAATTYRATGDLESLGSVTAQMGRAHAFRGTQDEGIQRITPLLGLLTRSGPSPSLAALYMALYNLYFTSGRYSEALTASDQAADLARAMGDTRLWACATAYSADVLPSLDERFGDALPLAEESIPLLQEEGDLFFLYLAHLTVVAVQAVRGEFDSSRLSCERLCQVADRYGDPGAIAFAMSRRAWVTFMSGDWRHAREEIEQAVTISHRAGASWWSVYPVLEMGRLCLAQGDWEAALSHLDEVRTAAERYRDPRALLRASALLAELDVLQGRAAAAKVRLVPLLDRGGPLDSNVTYFLPVLAWAHLESGDVQQAADVVAQAMARLRPSHRWAYLVDALRVQAMVAVRQGHWAEATGALEEGIMMARSMPCPYAEGRLLRVYGEMHVQKGELEPAHERLGAALAIFRRLGARHDAEQVEQAIPSPQSMPPRAAALQPTMCPCEGHGLMAGSPADKRLSRTERQEWALERLRTDGPLSPRAYARALGVSVDTALRDLSDLTHRGNIVARGTTKDRRYCLNAEAG
jgi:tetratricopeptide (TPR) repeat protein/transcriptional regulator with XRE-family HTH domain